MQAREGLLLEGVGVDSHLEEAVEVIPTWRRNVSHIMVEEVLVEGFPRVFFVRISQIELGITFREGILGNLFPTSAHTLQVL